MCEPTNDKSSSQDGRLRRQQQTDPPALVASPTNSITSSNRNNKNMTSIRSRRGSSIINNNNNNNNTSNGTSNSNVNNNDAASMSRSSYRHIVGRKKRVRRIKQSMSLSSKISSFLSRWTMNYQKKGNTNTNSTNTNTNPMAVRLLFVLLWMGSFAVLLGVVNHLRNNNNNENNNNNQNIITTTTRVLTETVVNKPNSVTSNRQYVRRDDDGDNTNNKHVEENHHKRRDNHENIVVDHDHDHENERKNDHNHDHDYDYDYGYEVEEEEYSNEEEDYQIFLTHTCPEQVSTLSFCINNNIDGFNGDSNGDSTSTSFHSHSHIMKEDHCYRCIYKSAAHSLDRCLLDSCGGTDQCQAQAVALVNCGNQHQQQQKEAHTVDESEGEEDNEEEEEEDENDDTADEYNYDEDADVCFTKFDYATTTKNVGPRETQVGPCVFDYPKDMEPPEKWFNGIDYYFFRNTPTSKSSDKTDCLHQCVVEHIVGVGHTTPVQQNGIEEEDEKGKHNNSNEKEHSNNKNSHSNNKSHNRNSHNHIVGVTTIVPVPRVEEEGEGGNKSNNNNNNQAVASVQRAMIQEEKEGEDQDEVSSSNINNNSEEEIADDTAVVEVDDIMLVEAAKSGMTDLCRMLMQAPYNCNPLYRQIPEVGSGRDGGTGQGDNYKNSRSFNAIQEAIRGGYTEIVHILSQGNTQLVIDRFGRTIEDYVCLHGSPIRPPGALAILGIDVVKINKAKQKNEKKKSQATTTSKSAAESTGWNTQTIHAYDHTTCDIDVIEADGDFSEEVFFRDYFVTGRPLVLRNHTSAEELLHFQKSVFLSAGDEEWKTEEFGVGPTAYPSRTNQKNCLQHYTIEDLEANRVCEEMPDIPQVYAYHPDEEDFQEIWPDYQGDPLSSFNSTSTSSTSTNNNEKNLNTDAVDTTTINNASFRVIKEWFGHVVNDRDDLAWQVFFGGDGSGATYHWHDAAFNMLYVGTKEWKIAPPLYRGWSGMPALLASQALEQHLVTSNHKSGSGPTKHHIPTLSCIQQPGDLFFIPNSWGHMTINHGFTIGAAAIMPDYYQKDGSDQYRTQKAKHKK